MLKSTFTPILSSIHIKPRPSNLFPLNPRFLSNAPSPCPPTVRQNASLNQTPTIPIHHLPPTSAYVHLPFCRKRCHYCDFPILALGSSSAQNHDDDPRISNYVQLLIREIKATKPDFDHYPPLETVFFGGGTPSLVPPRLVGSLLDALRSQYGLCLDAEISMEMDPGTFDATKMKALLELGVNRVSLGVQAFQEELLKVCGRAHGLKEVHEAIEIVRSCGVENWSMDLISSLPHQTPEMWEESLRLAVQASPNHVSVYDLQVEQGTKFGSLYTPGEFPLPSDTQSATYYRMASKMLSEADYNHYEVSSYSKNDFVCKHNITYWKNKPFYGFGLGSASYISGERFSRPKKLKDYTTFVHDMEEDHEDEVEVEVEVEDNDEEVDGFEEDSVDDNEIAMDTIMLALRTSRGLELKSFREAFGSPMILSLCKVYEPYMKSGHVLFLDEQRREIKEEEVSSLISDEQKLQEVLGFIRLSDPDGFLLSNELISLAFAVLDP